MQINLHEVINILNSFRRFNSLNVPKKVNSPGNQRTPVKNSKTNDLERKKSIKDINSMNHRTPRRDVQKLMVSPPSSLRGINDKEREEMLEELQKYDEKMSSQDKLMITRYGYSLRFDFFCYNHIKEVIY